MRLAVDAVDGLEFKVFVPKSRGRRTRLSFMKVFELKNRSRFLQVLFAASSSSSHVLSNRSSVMSNIDSSSGLISLAGTFALIDCSRVLLPKRIQFRLKISCETISGLMLSRECVTNCCCNGKCNGAGRLDKQIIESTS